MGFFRRFLDKDNFIRSSEPKLNFGDDHILEVAYENPSDSASGFYTRAFIHFPISDPEFSSLTGDYNATLNIFNAKNNKYTDENYTIEIYPVTQLWNEGSGAHGYAVSAASNAISATQNSLWSTSGVSYSSSPSASITFVNGTENLTANITSFIEYWKTSTNYGLLFKFPDSIETVTSNYKNYKYFFSRNTDTFFAPYVDFTYTTPLIKDDINNLHLGTNKFFVYDSNVSTADYSGTACIKYDLSSTSETSISLTSYSDNTWYTTWSSTGIQYDNLYFIYSNTANNYSVTSTVTGTAINTSFNRNFINEIQANIICQKDYRTDETALFRASIYHYVSKWMGSRAVSYYPTTVMLYFIERTTRYIATQPQEMGYDQFGYNLEFNLSNLQSGFWYIPVLKITDNNLTFYRELKESTFYVR